MLQNEDSPKNLNLLTIVMIVYSIQANEIKRIQNFQ